MGEEKKEKRRSPEQAVRLSARGAFVLCEVYKVRRMTVQQVARLCAVPEKSFAAIDLCRRLRALKYLEIDDLFRDRSKLVVSLTDAGRRFAVDRLGRGHRGGLRDEAGDEFALHTLRGAELYVSIVTAGAQDWLAVRANADRFDCYSTNEGIDFSWVGRLNFKQVNRKVVPDAVIETPKERFLIEIERSTKTLGVVLAKVENYCHVFSLTKNTKDCSAYREKYADDRAPVVVFMLDSKERANNVAALVEKKKQLDRFPIPSLFIGSLDETARYLRDRVGVGTPLVDAPSLFSQAVRQYVEHIVLRSGMSSLNWPPNWRDVMRQIYPADEWPGIERNQDERIASARFREAAKAKEKVRHE